MRSLDNYTQEIKELKQIIITTQANELIKRQYQRRLHELIGQFVIEHKVFFTKTEEDSRYSELNKLLSE